METAPTNGKRRFALLGVAAISAVFLIGLAHLFSLRFTSGENYPPGSSLRADPRGTRVLHDSLVLLPDHQVLRNYESLSRIAPDPAGQTLLLPGYDSELLGGPIPRQAVEELDGFVRGGGRVVLAVAFVRPLDRTNAWADVRRRLHRGAPAPAGPATRVLSDLWGFKLEDATGVGGEALHDGSIPALAPRMRWPGTRRFGSLVEAWRVVYARDGEAVVMERSLGQGSVVLLADDFRLSNEALRHRRETAFLSWLLGGNRRIIFNETHLGLEQEPGLASLVRRYRLGGAVIGLLLLAGLYLWQQAVPFVPRVSTLKSDAPGAAAEPVQGRRAADGFRNLLRRSVPLKDLPVLLFQQWQESAGRRVHPEQLRDVQDVINLENARRPKDRDPIRLYHEIHACLNPKRH